LIVNVQLTNVVTVVEVVDNPPPVSEAVLPLKVQLVRVVLSPIFIPPPFLAEFSVKMQSVSIAAPSPLLTPPPPLAVFILKVQRVNIV
jgi:hypothetical protein